MLITRLRTSRAMVEGLLSQGGGPSERTFRVWPTDVDLNIHLTNSRYAQWMDAGRTHLFASSGILWPALRSGVSPVLVHLGIEFQHELKLGARVTLQSRVCGQIRKAMDVEQRFLVGERVCAVGHAHVVWVGKSGVVDPSACVERLRSRG